MFELSEEEGSGAALGRERADCGYLSLTLIYLFSLITYTRCHFSNFGFWPYVWGSFGPPRCMLPAPMMSNSGIDHWIY